MKMETAIVPSDKENSLNHVCFGCNLPISDRFLLKVLDKLWHDSCLRCCQCNVALKEKCFARDANLYCKQDFYKLYGVQCSGCEEGVFPSDLIRKVGAKIFHMSCLKCFQCSQEVSTGDQLYILDDGTFLCKTDYDNQESLDLNKTKEKTKVDQELDSDETLQTPSVNGENPASDEDEEPNRRRGPRTTIKAKQLEVLKSAFLATPKPSRHIREKLAQDTGLSMRVIQVWFQNRRSKERRVKQLSVHDARRGFKKGKEADLTYPFFHNPASLDDYHQRRYSFDLYGTTNNNDNSSCNGATNNLPLSLPVDPSILRKNQETLIKGKKNESSDYVIENFTSQLQDNGFKNHHNVQNYPSPVRSTYERL